MPKKKNNLKYEYSLWKIVIIPFLLIWFIIIMLSIFEILAKDDSIQKAIISTAMIVSIAAYVIFHFVLISERKCNEEKITKKEHEVRMMEDKYLKYEHRLVKEFEEKDNKLSEVSNKLILIKNMIHDEHIKNEIDEMRKNIILPNQ